MDITKIKTRSVLFTYHLDDWDLNLHLILGDTYNYIIDTGLGSNSVTPILEYLEGDKKPIIVINTHHHWDHIWGNHVFQNSVIIAHSRCREMIEEKWDSMIETCKSYIDGSVEKVLPTIVFEDSLYFPDDGIRLFYTPGHSEDGISIYDEKDNVLNAGDNIGDSLDDIVPSIDTDKTVLQKTMLQYESLDFDTCISGHNVVLDKSIISKIRRELDK